MRAIYGEGWALLCRAFPLLVLLMALVEGLTRYLDHSSLGTELMLFVMIAYFLHRDVLFGENIGLRAKKNPEAPKQRLGRFFLVSFLLIGTSLVVGILFPALLGISGKGGSRIIYFAFALLTYWTALSLFGTSLPAAASGEKFSLNTLFWRARQTGLRVAGQILAGPVIVWLACFLLLLVLLWGAGAILPTDWLAAPGTAFASGIAQRLVGVIPTAFAVVILCHAYLDTKEQPLVSAAGLR